MKKQCSDMPAPLCQASWPLVCTTAKCALILFFTGCCLKLSCRPGRHPQGQAVFQSSNLTGSAESLGSLADISSITVNRSLILFYMYCDIALCSKGAEFVAQYVGTTFVSSLHKRLPNLVRFQSADRNLRGKPQILVKIEDCKHEID